MPKPAIALACIVKDDSEAKIFERMLTSFMPYMSGLYVAVTGPSGNHKKIHKIVKKFGGTSISTDIETNPEIYSLVDGKIIFTNFAAARQVSWDMVEDGYDWIAWADVDDVLIGGDKILQIAEIGLEREVDSIYFTYWYHLALNERGEIEQVKIQHLRERLVRPGLFKWVSRLHEVLVPAEENFHPKNTVYENETEDEPIAWAHLTNDERTLATLERNKLILQIQYEEEQGKDPRTLFYLAKTHFDINTDQSLDEAIGLLEKYMEMSGWDEERANAYEYMGLIHAKKKDYRKAAEIFHKAIIEFPGHHLPYLRLADAYYQMGQNQFAEHWLDVALNMPAPKSGTTISNDHEVKVMTAALSYTKARMHNQIDDMEYWAGVRKKLMGGEDDGLYEDVLWHKHFGMAVIGLFNYSKWLKDNGYEKTTLELFNTIPEEMMDQPYINIMKSQILPPKKWGKKSVVYFASFGGPHFERWDEKSLETGIGGSETAVIRLSQEWARKGYEVTVFCDTQQEHKADGVNYVPYTRFNWNDEFNILILWRSPHLLDREIKAKKLYMDLHDVSSQLDWPESRWQKVDKIFVKSKYHRENLPKIPDERFEIISNGI